MFPETLQMLGEQGTTPDEFIDWFFRTRGEKREPYDFFKIKLDRFRRFALEQGGSLNPEKRESITRAVEREYHEMMAAYLQFNPED